MKTQSFFLILLFTVECCCYVRIQRFKTLVNFYWVRNSKGKFAVCSFSKIHFAETAKMHKEKIHNLIKHGRMVVNSYLRAKETNPYK